MMSRLTLVAVAWTLVSITEGQAQSSADGAIPVTIDNVIRTESKAQDPD